MISYLFQNSKKPFIYLGEGFSEEGCLVLTEPNEILTTNRRSEARKFLLEIQNKISQGYHAAGWISYEAGELFLNPGNMEEVFENPLFWFGIFSEPKVLDLGEISEWESKYKDKGYSAKIGSGMDQKEYEKILRKIRNFLYEGDIYQVNFTFPLEIELEGSLGRLFFELRKKQPVPYEAWIHTGDSIPTQRDILSFSPELFWEKKSNQIRTVPMKGTRPRGKNSEEDQKLKLELFRSEKDRAENLMITDLLRNDLGRISLPGSVEVSKLFSIEEYPTVFQMTSEIRSKLSSDIKWTDILEALFPGGSITGAPKKRSSEIIQSLEKKRGVYTGGIFYLSPQKEISSIAIRTLEFLQDSSGQKRGRMGVGSGITINSDPNEEWEECWSKAKFLNDTKENFYLFTTTICKRRKIYFLNDHKERMRTSAKEFGFSWKEEEWESAVGEATGKINSDNNYKVKIILLSSGEFKSEVSEFDSGPKEGKILFSGTSTDKKNRFFYHKTNIREIFSEGYESATSKGYIDRIYTNREGHLTEGAIHSIFLFLNREWITPSLEEGILPGVARKRWIKKLKAKERRISKEDLILASKIILVNSLRGIRRVTGVDFE
ncbi:MULTISPECIES: aminodeoxychorismate synthase component I [unclassified Leptospira]|uniref:aminodeoxychorismate synthase component I n=1 Tax=unclassified Leptospira TaxID=2633828 RepID=UPI0002BFC61B|nr:MULTISPECIES: aminodeoxychorismate synthase component I [unclassified Leptospira]EMJ99884.1 aminodeoxychorismate synthase, component I [Leptospira sp. B5-022]MCR1791986.1 aminodeoxychorismate synthase component I [Leptospira sp. id769339]